MREVAQPMCAGGEPVCKNLIPRQIDEKAPEQLFLAAGEVVPLVRCVVPILPHWRDAWITRYPRQAKCEVDSGKGEKKKPERCLVVGKPRVKFVEKRFHGYLENGLMTLTPAKFMSETLRVTMTRLWASAMATICASSGGRGCPAESASAIISPHFLAASMSKGSMLSPYFSMMSPSSHSVSGFRLGSSGLSLRMPWRISAIVMADIKKSLPSKWRWSQDTTAGFGLFFRSSLRTQVSTR